MLHCIMTIIVFCVMSWKDYDYFKHCIESEDKNYIGASIIMFINICMSALIGLLFAGIVAAFYQIGLDILNYLKN